MTRAEEILTEASLQDSYWGRRILTAEARGFFNPSDGALSDDWTTCACGQTDLRLSPLPSVAPRDPDLRALGSLFGEVVQYGWSTFSEAAICLVNIEVRAAQLISKMEDPG